MAATKKRSKLPVRILVLLLTLSLALTGFLSGGADSAAVAKSFIQLVDKDIQTKLFDYLDGSVVFQLPDTVKDTDTISLIIQTQQASLLDVYRDTDSDVSFTEYAFSAEADKLRGQLAEEKAALLALLDKTGISYNVGADYDTVISGFEIVITARDFETVCTTFGDRASTYVSEVYKAAETQLVENDVKVYDTGIFDSSDFKFDGTGMVVAVLDTGLDYDHSAFSVANFTADRAKLGLTFEDVAALVGDTKAAELHAGLTGSDVYINEKVPFAFDYADEDPDVYPINSDHGTHVSGIIAGKDDTITGVAPNAQLVEMKIFSDILESARASWILAAVEDCVILGVDVINMSIGTSCGFSRESDEEFISGVYQKVREQGISLIVAASNSYNSTYGSEKNGNLGLTSNPDSATVGSPSTYDGAMSVASVSGVKTPYILYGETIVYFTESSDRVSEEKNFVEELLDEGTDSIEIEYVTIPGAGRSADYTGIDVTGKIVLVSRGATNFEDKANVAQSKGAAGLIVYNNVSGDIKMNVGETTLPVCSISQDNGEMLAAAGTGTIKISRSQTSGPFISDFSSWGPSPSLGIKPEITAHGGSIYSAVPGQSYDRISGTSMATPNVSGVVALLRQYVKENFPDIADDNVAITKLVNQLMMSTADILLAKNGLPYSVRRQGAGLVNLDSCAAASAYIITYHSSDGSEMDKSKIELGDDPEKTGVYTLKFSIKNFGDTAQTYDLSGYVLTEGVSDTKTSHGDTTVTEEAYQLCGAVIKIESFDNCEITTYSDENGNPLPGSVLVNAGQTADLTVTITLSDEDKAYLNDSFKNGMYVEGFIVLDNIDEEQVDLNVPYLAFYGDWTLAPIFDLDYFATNKDELDESLDMEDKTLPDAYATRPIGGISGDYVSYLGSYYFEQNPASGNKIAADRKYIALTNQETGINSLRYVWGGLLRNAARIDVTIVDDTTGEIVFETSDTDVRKSYGEGGSIYPANIEIEFSAIEHNLNNNTNYTVTLKSYLDYGDGGADTNLSNEFSFPLVADFEAPAITDCEFYTEYDSSTKELRYYAKMSVYDNHYSMGMQVGYVGMDDAGTGYMLNAFDRYMTPIYSSFNTDSYVVYELTDHINAIRQNATNRNTITVACYDYALNMATYEIELPDDFLDITFAGEELVLSPNEVLDLSPLVYPETEWANLLEYYCTVPAGGEVVRVVNNKLVGVAPGKCVVIAKDPVTKKQATISVRVLGEEDEGYMRYDKPVLDTFDLTGYYVNKAYYFLSSEERDIGLTGDEMKFASDTYSLSLYPSESVTLRYLLDAYFPKDTEVVFQSSNTNIVDVDENGTITAVAEGFGSISVSVTMDGKSTYYSKSISITVKDPYVNTGASLTHYFGLGGDVEIPASLSLTEIGNYAFSNFDYIDKEPHEITEADPEATKIWYIGDDTITSVVIPEGVKSIGDYAFANLTKLKTVILPSTLERIDQGAFLGCTSLTKIEGLDNVKFINQSAFQGCKLSGKISLDSAVAVADYAFAGNEKLNEVTLSENTRSVGAYAFNGCTGLKTVNVNADFVKIGQYIFSDCASLKEISINTAVVPRGAFAGCSELETVALGKDVAVIGEYAFGGTNVSSITIDAGNPNFKVSSDGTYVTNADGTTLVLVLPSTSGSFNLSDPKITVVATGAFSGAEHITAVTMPYVTSIGDYAFAGCAKLMSASFGPLTEIGDYALYGTAITVHPDLSGLTHVGDYAFAESKLVSVTIPDGMTIGEGCFSSCADLETVTIGNGVVIGDRAFYLDSNHNWSYDYVLIGNVRHYYYIFTSPLHSLTIGDNALIGDYAFYGAAELTDVALGKNAVIGDYAFYNASMLESIDLSAVTAIGDYAFSGDVLYMGLDSTFSNFALDEDGYYIYTYHAPALTTADLTAAERIGSNAFAYCRDLTSVVLGSGVTVLPEAAFSGCASLAEIDLTAVTEIGDYALSETAIEHANIFAATSVGEFAFYGNDALATVTFSANGVTIDEGAFSYCHNLATLMGEEYATAIGDYAFAYTAVTDADLTAAETIGRHAFIKEERTPFTVTLGAALKELGDNPFAMCDLPAFSQTEVTEFNGTSYETQVTTFDLSETVRVIDGSVYQAVPNGLELISYAGDSTEVNVAKDTVRITAMAFAGSDVQKVVLPHTVCAIGHKAFFGCADLTVVSFSSYNAPVLEEEYDYFYFASFENISSTGDYTFVDTDGVTEIIRQGLGITPYFMWNAAESPNSVYYGANFVDYIGHFEPSVIMVRPMNGQNYDSFIMDQYFSTVLDGAAAADATTLKAIAAISKLPDTVSLSDKAMVQQARQAYDQISTLEQRALVTEYSKLTQAEKRITDLEYLANSNGNTEAPPTDVDVPSSPAGLILALALTGVTVLLIVIPVIIQLCRKSAAEGKTRKRKSAAPTDAPSTDGSEEA